MRFEVIIAMNIRTVAFGITALCNATTRIPKFAGSNPAEAVGFLKGDKKSSARLPSEGK
jgi:hypothetical protein